MPTSVEAQRSEESMLRLYRGLPGFEAALEPWRVLERMTGGRKGGPP